MTTRLRVTAPITSKGREAAVDVVGRTMAARTRAPVTVMAPNQKAAWKSRTWAMSPVRG